MVVAVLIEPGLQSHAEASILEAQTTDTVICSRSTQRLLGLVVAAEKVMR